MAVVRILIAAGKAADADDLASKAKTAGYRVKARASSGKEAFALAEAKHPDLVLIDTHLRGDMSIPAVVKKLQMLCNTPVVLVASSDNDIPVPRKNTAVPYGCLVRPFGARQFRQVIDAAVYRHSLEQGASVNGSSKREYDGAMVRKIAHDINNSLSSALANIQLSRRSDVSGDRLYEHLNGAEDSVLRARDRSRQLLTSSAEPETEAGAQRSAHVPASPPRGTGAHKKDTAAAYRILLMDDEAAILSATSEMLSFLGHQVTVAENGDEAIDLYKKAQTDAEPFDAVILDVTVPGGSGAQETLPRPGARSQRSGDHLQRICHPPHGRQFRRQRVRSRPRKTVRLQGT